VSTVRWNPKGMRRSTGPVIDGGNPVMNRSAKGGDRSSLLHYGEGVLIHPTSTKVCADGTVRKNSA
jgi:hypothetical protein